LSSAHRCAWASSVSWQNCVVPVELITERLRLREWTSSDLETLVELFARPEIWRYPLGRGFTPEETQSFLARQIAAQDRHDVTLLAAEDRTNHELLGYVGLAVPNFLPEIMPSVEIGWRLHPRVWGRGLATEGALAVLTYAFTVLDLEEIVSIYHPENIASGAIMRRIGMHFDRDTVDPVRDVALRVYRLSKTQWTEASPTSRGD
jgi:RimJ/RimL family protein N-acetyltransferase